MIQKKLVESFEEEFAAYIGTKYAIGTSMGRTALFVILKAIGLEENDEVIIPAYICEVVPNSVVKLKGVPIFVDINLENYHISLFHLQSLINIKTKAIIIDHIFGYPEEIDAIKEIIKKSGQKIFLIEDAAHALGAEYKNHKVGSLGDIGFFQFYKKYYQHWRWCNNNQRSESCKKNKDNCKRIKRDTILNQNFFWNILIFR